ncbi:MAG TPA: phosphatase PAP2 family protein [Kofleriaceae bacterium]|jgi:membrane-associated phospholipid phosphatase
MAARRWILTAILVSAEVAHADDAVPEHIDRGVALGVTGAALAVGALAKLIPTRDFSLWEHEPASFDEAARGTFNARAAHIADGLLTVSLVAPAAYLTGSTIDDADGDRLLIYTEAMAVDVAVASVVKHLVQRPRPYAYSKDPAVQRYTKDAGDDAVMSFYSGHAAVSFGAATAGAYLLSESGENEGVKTTAWAAGFGVAAMTATLRVRSGKHFPTDVVVGSLVGVAIGYGVPALHSDHPYVPTGTELSAALGSVAGGIILGSVLPMGRERAEADRNQPSLHMTPTVMQSGAGFGVVGAW